MPAFSKMVCASFWWVVVVLRGRAIFPALKRRKKNFPRLVFPCVGQSVSGWVRLELTPPPFWGRSSAVGADQKQVPPFLILPPPPLPRPRC